MRSPALARSHSLPRINLERRNCGWRWRAWVVALVWFAFAVGADLRLEASEEPIDLGTIQLAVEQRAQKIKTLSGRVRVVHHNQSKAQPPTNTFEGLAYETEFRYHVTNGWMYHDDQRTWVMSGISQQPFRVRTIESFDGTTRATLLHTLEWCPIASAVPPNQPYKLRLHSSGGQSQDTLLHAMGLASEEFGNLQSLLRDREVRISGYRRLDNDECIVVTIPELSVELVFDPQKEFVLRQYKRLRSLSEPVTGSRESIPNLPELRRINSEFKEFVLPDTGESVWVPMRSTRMGRDAKPVDLEVIDLRLNEPLEQAQFQIDPASLPDGIRIEPLTGPPSYTGDRRDLFDELQRQIDDQDKSLEELRRRAEGPRAMNGPRPTGRPTPMPAERKSDWILWLPAVVIALAGYRLWSWRRHRITSDTPRRD
ncbi:MAG: hypothetical protein AABP62_21155 [Planctomycetota bacterium]